MGAWLLIMVDSWPTSKSLSHSLLSAAPSLIGEHSKRLIVFGETLSRDFPRKDHADPPPPPPLEMEQNYLLVFYSQLFKRVPVVSCLGALTGPREKPPLPPSRNVTKLFILDFNCQPLGRVLICFMSVGPSISMGGGVPKVYSRKYPVN